MATIDYYLSPVDIKDAHLLTRSVERSIRESEVWDVPFAPITGTMSRRIKLRVRHVDAAGLASFWADNADTPVVSSGGTVLEQYMELVAIAEKDILKQSDLINLQSPDELVANAAAEDALAKAIRLRRRNMNRTKWMAWQAAKDELTITYPDGTTIAIDYDLDKTAQNDWFSSSHLPTAAASWATAATDVIEDVYDWSKIIADDLGVDQSEVVMYCRTAVWRYLQKNTGIKGELSSTDPRVITPKRSEVVEILGIGEIRIENGFYVTSASNVDTRNYFLDEGHILLTGPDSVNGAPIMEVKDGPVARVVNGDIVVAANPGALAELYINEEAVTKNIRVQTARLPQMNYPAAFVYCDIVP